MKKIPFYLLSLCLLLVACHIPRPILNSDTDQERLQTMVAMTEQAIIGPTITTLLQPSSTPTDSLPPTITPTFTPNVTNTPEPGLGSISGNIYGYPYGTLPRLAIVAFSQTSPGTYWYWITGVGNTYYSMDGYVTTGKYQVVAYDSSGNAGGCATIIEVKTNEMATCDISEWGGGYPAKPAGVP